MLDRALKQLGRRKTLFATVQREAATLKSTGNVLAGEANVQQVQSAELARTAIRMWAQQPGVISTALTDAAQMAKDGSMAAAAQEFLDTVEQAIADGNVPNIEYLQPMKQEQEADPTGSLFQEGKGSVEFTEAGQAIIRAQQAADFSTWVHEHSHVMRRYLTAEQEAVAGAWAGAAQSEDGAWEWNPEAEEKFAEGFEDYLWEGRAPNNALREIWRMFSRLLRNIYAKTRHVLNDDIRGVYEELIVRQDAPHVHAFDENTIAVDGGDYGVFTSAQSAVVLRMKPSEDTQQELQQEAQEGALGGPPVELQAWRGNELLAERTYESREDALRDISGVPTMRSPNTLGDSTYRMRAPEAPQELFEIHEIEDRVWVGWPRAQICRGAAEGGRGPGRARAAGHGAGFDAPQQLPHRAHIRWGGRHAVQRYDQGH